MIEPDQVWRYVGTLRTAREQFACVLWVIDYPPAYDWHVEIGGSGDRPAFTDPGREVVPVTLHMDCGCVFTAEVEAHNLQQDAQGRWTVCFRSCSELRDTPTRCKP